MAENKRTENRIKEERKTDAGKLQEDIRKQVKRYARTAWFLLKKAVEEVLGPEKELIIEFNVGGNYYAKVQGYRLIAGDVEKLKAQMLADVSAALPVEEKNIPCSKAVQIFREQGREKNTRAIHYRNNSRFTMHYIGGCNAYFAGALLDNTSEVKDFDLIPYASGMLLVLPGENGTFARNPVRPAGNLVRTQEESQDWADRLGLTSLTDFNDRIVSGTVGDVVLMQEAFFEKRLGDVAEEIIVKKKKFILIAGPSSSGKTTTAYRLGIQLRAWGVKPVTISADNYFRPLEERTLLPDGTPDLESIRAVDTELFSADMIRLLKGEEVDMPSFNFAKQRREYKGKKLKLDEQTVLIVEGIHCLNPLFSEKLPEESRTRIYVSALTPLCLDSMNPIPTSECRLLRRIVRDHRTRGYSASDTIRVWDNVRQGEEDNIFPYQEDADVIVNTAMIYELSVLKSYVEPLLYGIGENDPGYGEARRLLRFLSFVLPLPADLIPGTSVVREFIGGSCIET